ncbi:hypothetical protein TSUD_390110 [Trifolium subterraneum]|uniref:FAS1 domain-containing protein n=1 Tax=Trifolium subterraneum TaxID=3900 RepID=A0A2Z6P4B6_TRISU|nr:hypothetical protein TSUD_390110 [Trifolium subterraneum]
MNSIFPLRAVLVAVVLLLSNAFTVVKCIPNREFDSMLTTLRSRGYHLFCNAILTSDLRIDLLAFEDANSNETHSFTFFAPTDSSLFALDMAQTASSYTDTLRYHIIPRRLSLAELRRLPNGYTLPTLLSTRRISVTRRAGSFVTVIGGVDVAFPGLFYGRHVVVHGLSGILHVRSYNPSSPAPATSPIRSPHHRHFSPRRNSSSPVNQTVLDPVPRSVSFNFTGKRDSHDSVEAPSPSSIPAKSPEIGTDNVHSPVNFSNSPFVAPDLPPSYPGSDISFPPEGFSDTASPSPLPVDLEPVVQKNSRVSLLEVEGAIEMPVKSEALDGIRKCETEAVGLKNRISDNDLVDHMQCYAA